MRKKLTALAACAAGLAALGFAPSERTVAQDGGFGIKLGPVKDLAQDAVKAVDAVETVEDVIAEVLDSASPKGDGKPNDEIGKDNETGPDNDSPDEVADEATDQTGGTVTSNNDDVTEEENGNQEEIPKDKISVEEEVVAEGFGAGETVVTENTEFVILQNPVSPDGTLTAVTSRPVIGTVEPAEGPLVMRDADLPHYTENQLLIFLRDDGSNARTIAAANGLTLKTSQRVPLLGLDMVLTELAPGDTVKAALERLKGNGDFAWAQPNYIYQLLGNSRSRELKMHGLEASAAAVLGGLPPLNSNATIVLIDSPIDREHPSFQGIVIKQIGLASSSQPSPHGTAIAEILVGHGEYQGVARGAKLVSIPAFAKKSADDQHDISTTNLLISAFSIAEQINPNVMNLSFGTLAPVDKAIGDALAALYDKGVCIAAAAGNGGPTKGVLFPARIPSTIAVSAVDLAENGYASGSRGVEIDIAALGVDLNAAVPGGRRPVTGTSFATPLVAGAMLRMPACSTARRPEALRKALAMDAKDLGDSGHDPIYGAGLLQFGEAAMISDALVLSDYVPVEETTDYTLLAAGGGAIGAGGLFFLAWRRRKKKSSATN